MARAGLILLDGLSSSDLVGADVNVRPVLRQTCGATHAHAELTGSLCRHIQAYTAGRP